MLTLFLSGSMSVPYLNVDSPYQLLYYSIGSYRIRKPSNEASGSAGFPVGGDIGSGGAPPMGA